MTENNRFDILIVGAGQAGIPLAHDLAKDTAAERVRLEELIDICYPSGVGAS